MFNSLKKRLDRLEVKLYGGEKLSDPRGYLAPGYMLDGNPSLSARVENLEQLFKDLRMTEMHLDMLFRHLNLTIQTTPSQIEIVKIGEQK